MSGTMMSAINHTTERDTLNAKSMKMINVRIRNIIPDGKKPHVTIQIPVGLENEAPLAAVKKKVIEELQPSWANKGVNLTPDNIIVFRVYGSTANEVGEGLKLVKSEQDAAQAQEDEGSKQVHDEEEEALFVAVEYFTIVPEDLFRTAKLSQVGKATYAHPDHAVNRYTSVSPLYCAGFTRSERKLPWYGVDSGSFHVHGVSIWGRDESERAWADGTFDPFADIGVDEEKGDVFSMTIDQCINSVEGYHQAEGARGFLGSNFVYENFENHGIPIDPKPDRINISDTNKTLRKEKTKKTANGKKTKKTADDKKTKKTADDKMVKMATSRAPFFRFKLKKDLDLSEYGVAVIFDNSKPLHYTLVITSNPSGDRPWVEHKSTKLYVPEDYFSSSENEVRGNIFTLNPRREPTSFFGSWPDPTFFYLPKVAALFALDDMKLEASAEPVPLQVTSEDDDGRHMIYEGALVLYHLDLGWDVVLSIEALEKAQYVVNELDQWSRATLLMVLRTRRSVDVEVAVDALKGDDEWDANRALDALQYFEDALVGYSSEESSASTKSPPVLGNYIKETSAPQGENDKGNTESPSKSESTSGTPAATEPSLIGKDPRAMNTMEEAESAPGLHKTNDDMDEARGPR